MAAESAATLSFDPDALREKYRQERDKRLRKDGNAQYLEVTGEFSHFLEDPYVKPIEIVNSQVEAPAGPAAGTADLIRFTVKATLADPGPVLAGVKR